MQSFVLVFASGCVAKRIQTLAKTKHQREQTYQGWRWRNLLLPLHHVERKGHQKLVQQKRQRLLQRAMGGIWQHRWGASCERGWKRSKVEPAKHVLENERRKISRKVRCRPPRHPKPRIPIVCWKSCRQQDRGWSLVLLRWHWPSRRGAKRKRRRRRRKRKRRKRKKGRRRKWRERIHTAWRLWGWRHPLQRGVQEVFLWRTWEDSWWNELSSPTGWSPKRKRQREERRMQPRDYGRLWRKSWAPRRRRRKRRRKRRERRDGS